FSLCVSSEAKSSSGRHFVLTSTATTENPASASLQASVPPPAPVPTIAKSTASFSPYSRIGIQPPWRNTSGARPCFARGLFCGSSADMLVPANRVFHVAVLHLGGFPGIAPVVSHSHISTRTCGTAPADLVPRGRMGVIGEDDVAAHAIAEKGLGRDAAPGRAVQLALLHPPEQRVLFIGVERAKFAAMRLPRFGIERAQASAPGFPLRRHSLAPVTVLTPAV